MQIPPARLERYEHFARLNSPDGRPEHYDPDRGLEALLSAVTPDTKVVVLMAMARNRNEYFYGTRRLYSAVLEQILGIGLPQGAYPLSENGTWKYCEDINGMGDKIDGSLVNVGAVVKHVHMPTPSGLKTGYQVSSAGAELAVPLGLAAIEFVWKAINSDIWHKYDSMWRVLGSVVSSTNQRKQLTVFYVVKHLVENLGYHRITDIENALHPRIARTNLSNTLISLGDAGIIDYQSPLRDINGRRGVGFVSYALSNSYMLNLALKRQEFNREIDRVYHEIKIRRPGFDLRNGVVRILTFILNNPSETYEYNDLARKSSFKWRNQVSSVLSALEEVGVLERTINFRGHSIMSRARANNLTSILYHTFLVPARESANTLTPYEINITDLNTKMELFFENYQAERSHIGPEGGKETRNWILQVLMPDDALKLSAIVQRVNMISTRNMSSSGVRRQLIKLKETGQVISPKRGYYQLNPNREAI